MPQLSLFLLGSPRLERDGTPIEVDTRKAIALLAYLALSSPVEPQSRDVLVTLLWPDYDEANARASLRRTLSSLNRALAGTWLEIGRESIGLVRDLSFWCDVDQFRSYVAECGSHGHSAGELCSACLEPLTKAAALYRADFMAGFTLRDSPNFDEWQFFQMEGLRRELAGALERLAHGHSDLGQFEPAIAHTRRWLALDPLHEPAHRQLMQLYAWAGQHAAALRQYRECVRILEQELGVPPLEETTHLYRAIIENRVLPVKERELKIENRALKIEGFKETAPSSTLYPLASSIRPLVDYPFVGRAIEWAALLDTYASISANGHWVILEGEAGIGKTRLAEEFLAYVRTQGGTTLTVRCYEGETNLAYGPFVEGMRAVMAEPSCFGRLEDIPAHGLSEAARLLPELANIYPGLPPAPPLDSPGAQSRFFEGLSQVMLAWCRNIRPSVLFLDDLHWADEASLDLLTYVVRRPQGRPLCLLTAWRSEQVPVGHRLRHLLAEAQRTGAATLVPLSRLSHSAVLELVRSTQAAGANWVEKLGEHLYRETEGLPFFLIEYLAMMAKSPEVAGQEDWVMPASVRDLLRSRLAVVSETGWQLLTSAAVIGRSFGFDILREASGRSDEETITALEGLMAHGVIIEVRDQVGEQEPVYDFCHEKLRSFVYEETSLARRRLLHRRVGESMVSRVRGRTNLGSMAGQIAHHYRLAGQETEAAEFFKLAGEHARNLFANAEALAHFRAALALGHLEAAAIQEAIGDLQTLSGKYGEALTAYETAAALGQPERLGRLEHKLGGVYHRQGEWDLAERHFQAALDALGPEGSPGERAQVYADWSRTAHRRGQTERALELARQALELAEVSGDVRALAQAHNILGNLANGAEKPEEARHHLQQSLALAEQLGDPGVRAAALNNLALAYGAAGQIEEAIKLAETGLSLCVTQGDRHREAALHNNLADLLHAAGQAEAAMSHLKQAVSIFAEIGASAPQPEIWRLVTW
jgi:DNA-binding SARP family transcriptional activator